MSDVEKEKYQKIIDGKADTIVYTDVIKNLTEYLKRYFKEDCIVIIDEF